MIGKRAIRLKRPAALCAVSFVTGIFFAKYSYGTVFGVVLGMFAVIAVFLKRLSRGRRRISVADKLLVVVPVFVLLGFFVMNRTTEVYERNRQSFSDCMRSGRELLAVGTVAHIRQTEQGIRFELTDAAVAPYNEDETEYSRVGTLLVYTEDLSAENGIIKHGQKVFVYGKGSMFEVAPNPGGFDAKGYYFSLGITGAVQSTTVRIKSFSYHRLNQALVQAKNELLNQYVTYLGEEGAGVISSMLLGERALLSEETRERYQHGGISHILAISGLHVSLIGTALYTILRRTILGRNGAIPVACAGVILYGTFVEAGTSTKRAVIMFLLLLLATALGRTYDTLSAMSVSVIVILWGCPGALYTASFQLSFAAAYGASIVAMLLRDYETLQRNTEKKRLLKSKDGPEKEVIELAKQVAKRTGSFRGALGEYLKEKIRSFILFGLAIQVVTFPFTVYHFFEYPIYGFFLNPIVVPLMTILLLCGLLTGVCGVFVPWLGYFFAGGTAGVLRIYDMLCGWVERLPGALLLFGRPAVWQIVVYFLIVAVCLCVWKEAEKKRVRSNIMLFSRVQDISENPKLILCVLLLLPIFLLPHPGKGLEVAFLDVGQGDGIILREGGTVLAMDGGSTSVQNVGEKRMIPYLKSQGIRVIDCAIVSHTDNDHISGIKEILEAMPTYSKYRESIPGYTGTPIIKRIALPALYDFCEDANGVTGGQTGEISAKSEGERNIDPMYLSLVKLAEEKMVEVYYMAAGDRMRVGRELELFCLAPEDGVMYADKNAASMVLLASYGEFEMLLTGDMDKESEERLLKSGVLTRFSTDTGRRESVSVEVLKVAHHGSYTASSEEFIAVLRPQISIISCGKDNRYGHPHKETLETLYEANSRILRTDESGCVMVKIGKDVDVEEFKKER